MTIKEKCYFCSMGGVEGHAIAYIWAESESKARQLGLEANWEWGEIPPAKRFVSLRLQRCHALDNLCEWLGEGVITATQDKGHYLLLDDVSREPEQKLRRLMLLDGRESDALYRAKPCPPMNVPKVTAKVAAENLLRLRRVSPQLPKAYFDALEAEIKAEDAQGVTRPSIYDIIRGIFSFMR